MVPLQALAAIQVTALGWFLGKQVADAKHIHDLGTVALDWRADFFPHRHRAGADRTRAAKCGGGAGCCIRRQYTEAPGLGLVQRT